MAYLGDFLGSILKELTISRLQSDIEALRVAEHYKNSELLEDAPIPRFRLPEVSIDIPLIISEEPKESYTAKEIKPLNVTSVRTILTNSALDSGLELSKNMLSKFGTDLKIELDKIWKEPIDLFSGFTITRELQAFASRYLVKYLTDEKTKPEIENKSKLEVINRTFKSSFSYYFQKMLVDNSGKALRLKIQAETSKIREVDDTSALVRCSISIKEDGFELVRIKRDEGDSYYKLVPE